jgi:YD repeat-containing protein
MPEGSTRPRTASPCLSPRPDYNGRGQPTAITYSNGVTTTDTYDPDRFWLDRIQTTVVSGTGNDLDYHDRDEAGRIKSVTNSAVTSQTEDWTYSYDDFGQLTKADNQGQNSQDRSYAHDLAGNMTCNSGIDS